MKIIIKESRIEEIVLNYIIKELGEYTPITHRNYDGVFKKNGEVVAATWDVDIYIEGNIYKSIKNLFSIKGVQTSVLIRKAATKLTNKRYIYVFPGDIEL
jgi:hypothetical protein